MTVDRVVGRRRGRDGGEWRWLPLPGERPKPGAGGGNPRQNLWFVAFGAALVATGIILLAVFIANSAGDSRSPSAGGPGAADRGSATDTASVTAQEPAGDGAETEMLGVEPNAIAP
jgi:hypothetical protein